MVPLAAGLVVLVRFPFSDLSQTKLRPAVVLANAGRGDWILCQVTSKPYADSAAVRLETADFQQGSLQVTSYARPGKLFTASGDLVERVVGALRPESVREVIAAVAVILRGSERSDESLGWSRCIPTRSGRKNAYSDFLRNADDHILMAPFADRCAHNGA